MPVVDFEDLFSQADNFRNDAKVSEAVRAYLDIVRLASEEHEQSYKARAYHLAGVSAKEAVNAATSSYYRDAIKLFDEAEKLYRQLGDDISLGDLYRDRAIINDYAGKLNEAIPNFQKAIEILEREKAAAKLAITYDKLGLHFYLQGQYQEAKNYMEKARQTIRQEPTAGFFASTILLDLSRVEYKLGNYHEALEFAEESLSWFEAEHPGESYKRRLAQLSALIALIHSKLGQKEQASTYVERFELLIREFDPAAARILQAEIAQTASSNG